jgi:hypothetical protein
MMMMMNGGDDAGYLHKLDNNRMRFQYRKWDTGKVWDEIWIERTTH